MPLTSPAAASAPPSSPPIASIADPSPATGDAVTALGASLLEAVAEYERANAQLQFSHDAMERNVAQDACDAADARLRAATMALACAIRTAVAAGEPVPEDVRTAIVRDAQRLQALALEVPMLDRAAQHTLLSANDVLQLWLAHPSESALGVRLATHPAASPTLWRLMLSTQDLRRRYASALCTVPRARADAECFQALRPIKATLDLAHLARQQTGEVFSEIVREILASRRPEPVLAMLEDPECADGFATLAPDVRLAALRHPDAAIRTAFIVHLHHGTTPAVERPTPVTSPAHRR